MSYYFSAGVQSIFQEAFLSRLTETGATESSSTYDLSNQMEVDREIACENIKKIVHNLVAAIDNLWNLKDGVRIALSKKLSEDGKS